MIGGWSPRRLRQLQIQPLPRRHFLARLIALDSISSKRNGDLVAGIAEDLRRWTTDVEVLPNEDGSKVNLLASFGPAVPGSVVLAGHVDAVPVDG